MYIAIRTYEETVLNPFSNPINRIIEPEFIKQKHVDVKHFRDKDELVSFIKHIASSYLKQYKFYSCSELTPKIEVSIDI